MFLFTTVAISASSYFPEASKSLTLLTSLFRYLKKSIKPYWNLWIEDIMLLGIIIESRTKMISMIIETKLISVWILLFNSATSGAILSWSFLIESFTIFVSITISYPSTFKSLLITRFRSLIVFSILLLSFLYSPIIRTDSFNCSTLIRFWIEHWILFNSISNEVNSLSTRTRAAFLFDCKKLEV